MVSLSQQTRRIAFDLPAPIHHASLDALGYAREIELALAAAVAQLAAQPTQGMACVSINLNLVRFEPGGPVRIIIPIGMMGFPPPADSKLHLIGKTPGSAFESGAGERGAGPGGTQPPEGESP